MQIVTSKFLSLYFVSSPIYTVSWILFIYQDTLLMFMGKWLFKCIILPNQNLCNSLLKLQVVQLMQGLSCYSANYRPWNTQQKESCKWLLLCLQSCDAVWIWIFRGIVHSFFPSRCTWEITNWIYLYSLCIAARLKTAAYKRCHCVCSLLWPVWRKRPVMQALQRLELLWEPTMETGGGGWVGGEGRVGGAAWLGSARFTGNASAVW